MLDLIPEDSAFVHLSALRQRMTTARKEGPDQDLWYAHRCAKAIVSTYAHVDAATKHLASQPPPFPEYA